MVCSSCGRSSENETEEIGIQLDVEVIFVVANTVAQNMFYNMQGTSINDCLQTTFKESRLGGGNQYYCERFTLIIIF